jgi:hypothetical protein
MLENNDLEIKGREFVDKAYGSLAVNSLTQDCCYKDNLDEDGKKTYLIRIERPYNTNTKNG